LFLCTGGILWVEMRKHQQVYAPVFIRWVRHASTTSRLFYHVDLQIYAPLHSRCSPRLPRGDPPCLVVLGFVDLACHGFVFIAAVGVGGAGVELYRSLSLGGMVVRVYGCGEMGTLCSLDLGIHCGLGIGIWV
jgi:hypothetical protein